ncbi:hypothetical protein MMC34_004500 [Xylographa carneopallida]|nr:hypothetical protein [Xylographa carneopallida]
MDVKVEDFTEAEIRLYAFLMLYTPLSDQGVADYMSQSHKQIPYQKDGVNVDRVYTVGIIVMLEKFHSDKFGSLYHHNRIAIGVKPPRHFRPTDVNLLVENYKKLSGATPREFTDRVVSEAPTIWCGNQNPRTLENLLWAFMRVGKGPGANPAEPRSWMLQWIMHLVDAWVSLKKINHVKPDGEVISYIELADIMNEKVAESPRLFSKHEVLVALHWIIKWGILRNDFAEAVIEGDGEKFTYLGDLTEDPNDPVTGPDSVTLPPIGQAQNQEKLPSLVSMQFPISWI